jgi:hypothetical protein
MSVNATLQPELGANLAIDRQALAPALRIEANMELVKCDPQQTAIRDRDDASHDTAELDRFFKRMFEEKYGRSLDEMLALAQLAEWYEARPISQLTMEEKMYLFGGRARITCTKCNRKFFEPILLPWVKRPDGKVVLCLPIDLHGCSKCSPAKPQPQEGDTFHPERRKARGKFITVGRGDRGHRDDLTFDGDAIKVAGTRDLTDESLTKDSLMSWVFQEQTHQNKESRIREQLLTPGNIEAAQIALQGQSIREIERRYDLTYHTARSGSNRLLVRESASGGENSKLKQADAEG